MRYYIVDDEIAVIKTLENIIEMRRLGEISGYNTDPTGALSEIAALKPDVLIVDLLMAKMDGITLVSEVKNKLPATSIVMLSKVMDKDMIEQAYMAGVEFYINKPVNIIEVERVLNNVTERLKMNSILRNIKGFIEDDVVPVSDKPSGDLESIDILFSNLGMIGEKGTQEIKEICKYVLDNNCGYSKEVLESVAELKGDTVKNIEQRIRRAIRKGLENIARIGINDYGDEAIQVYASYVFDYKNIKDEMDWIKGSSEYRGRINIAKFIEGIILYYNSVK